MRHLEHYDPKIEQIIYQAVEEWEKQGRPEEAKWGVTNFFTGRGIKMVKDLIAQENLAWLNNERCENCGGQKEGKLISLCDSCLQEE